MIKRFSPARLFGVLAAISCTCATLAFAAQVAPPPEKVPPDTSGIIVLDIAPPGKGDLPPVVFDHNKHTQGDAPGETCARCHDQSGALRLAQGAPESKSASKTGKDLENAFHETCVSCHAEVKAKGVASPPQKAECRSCHNASALPAGKGAPQKTDGGFDASLHARHIASDKIIVSGSPENCAACHHQVKQLSSPALKADSCRSCHTDSPGVIGAENAPPFAKAAHATCITCHASLTTEKTPLPLTCDSCHNAAKKAGYAKLAPVPRLDAGQPDTVRMGGASSAGNSDLPLELAPLAGESFEKEGTQQSLLPPVLFDHKLHEAAAGSCTSCHHKTLQKCSDCHTPAGSAKGGGVTLAAAMHTKDSPLSCMGCHETRKTAKPECAGCHAIMPKAKPMQADCASCHKPLGSEPALSGLPSHKRLPSEMVTIPGLEVPANWPPAVEPPGNAPGTTPGNAPGNAPGTTPGNAPGNALGNTPGKFAPERAALAKAPAQISLGALANEYEPSVFPHQRIVESLIAGLENSSPGMARFHSEPYSLCASCHHNSPPSATPPSCASCHAKGGSNTVSSSVGAPPPLSAAYHQQCISCHTAMNIKPAAVDCAGCHAKRAAPEKGGR